MPLEVGGPDARSGVLGAKCVRKEVGGTGEDAACEAEIRPSAGGRRVLTWGVLSGGFFITAWRKLLST